MIIGNETEALAYAESHELGLTSIPDIARAIAQEPKKNSSRPRTVIVTQGTEPTVVAVGNEEVKTFPVHAIDEKEINDTNGAG